MAKKKSANVHYVNNAEFSIAVVEYVRSVNEAKAAEKEIPLVPDYVALCFLRIAGNLSHKGNFIRYTYREEMVMDAVENCLRAVKNYNIDAPTRSGKPNAFSYFTQITWYAFLRRIAKEKKQQAIKEKYLSQSGVDTFLETNNDVARNVAASFIDGLKDRMDKVKEYDTELKEFAKTQKKPPRKKRSKIKNSKDSDLSNFM
jgi:hypothetical protein